MPAGRPSKLDKVIAADKRTGKPITVFDVIVQSIRRGEFLESAAGVARVDKRTVRGWLAVAKDAEDKADKHLPLTRHEARCLEFSHAVVEAECFAELDVGEAILAAGRAPSVTTTTVVKRVPVSMPDGTVEYHEQTETRRVEGPPNLAALLWRQEHRFPERWGRRQAIEVTGAGGEPLIPTAEEEAAEIADLRREIEAYRQGVADGQASLAGHPEPANGSKP